MTGERYHHPFDANTSYGAAIELVESSGATDGVALDLGCGYGAVAEHVAALGLTYVGVDVGAAGLADLASRGFETHTVDLLLPESDLVERLATVVGDRKLAVVLALDALEHLLDLPASLRVLRALVGDGDPSLVVSYPNVTHFDVGAKLLLGRWDTTDEGLLDRTHTQFLSGSDLPLVFAASGWHEVDAQDVVREVSDQCFPSYTPLLRPGTPAHDLLRSWRDQADPAGSTFQFVRRFVSGPSVEPPASADIDEDRPFITVIVIDDPAVPYSASGLAADLADQDDEVPEHDIVVVVDGDRLAFEQAFHGANGRYVVAVPSTSRVSNDWLSGFAEIEPLVTGAVLRSRAGCVLGGALHDPERPNSDLAEDATPVDVHGLDPAHAGAPGPVLGGAYAVPTEVGRTMGVGIAAVDGPAGWAVVLARAALLCRVIPTHRGVVLVGPDEVAPARVEAIDQAIVTALDRTPLLLRQGDAGRLAAERSRLAELEVAAVLEGERGRALGAELDTLRAHLADFGEQLAHVRAERDHWRSVASRKPGVRLRVLLRRIIDRSR